MAEAAPPKKSTPLSRWPLSRKVSLVLVALICVVLFAAIILQARTADFGLLFANLSSGDASSVVAWLKEQKIPYRLEDGGKAVHIPADKVYESRLELAGLGMPQGGGVGFEIFDKQSFGMTDFAQKINYQRALQGELARTISSLAPVEAARVHLAIPEKRLFREQQKDSTASVILKLVPGRQLSESQSQGIIHLVAGSIEGLEAENVTVVDSSGKILSQNRGSEISGPMTPGMLDFQHTLERRLENRAQSMLDRALGAGNSMVKVTATLDFLQQEQTEERYDPEGSVVRSEQSSEEKSGGQVAGGIPGAQSNLDGAPALRGSNPTSHSEETVNYEVSKVVSRKVFPVGTVKRLSVAVMVSDRFTPGAEGKDPTFVPRNGKEMQSIANMVRSAIGIDDARGDQIEVASMPFENVFYDEPLKAPSPVASYYEFLPFVKYALLVLAGVFLYFLLARPMLKTLRSEARYVTQMKTVEQLEAEMAGGNALPKPAADPAERLRLQAGQQRGPFAQIIKSWLREG